MSGYVERALVRFNATTPKQPQYSPHAYIKPNYGPTIQYTDSPDNSMQLPTDDIRIVQETIGTHL